MKPRHISPISGKIHPKPHMSPHIRHHLLRDRDEIPFLDVRRK